MLTVGQRVVDCVMLTVGQRVRLEADPGHHQAVDHHRGPLAHPAAPGQPVHQEVRHRRSPRVRWRNSSSSSDRVTSRSRRSHARKLGL